VHKRDEEGDLLPQPQRIGTNCQVL
jgi:hypothetical protein